MRLLVALLAASTAVADVVLDEKIMNLSRQAAILSSLAYEEHPIGDAYDHFGFYDEEPDQALIAKKDGYCFGAFRGTTLTWIDWQQNFDPGKVDACVSDTECCGTRAGFYKAYMTTYVKDFEASLRDCAKECENPNECVVLTGHSQGGAIAALAGFLMYDLNPYVITFGQPPTIDSPCPKINSNRWYRYVNTKDSSLQGISYDPVPFVPGLGADQFGHMLLLGNDDTGIAYIGLDVQTVFTPLNIAGFEAHNMVKGETEFPGYLDRIEAVMAKTSYPVRTSGYVGGTICTQGVECELDVCKSETTFSYKKCFADECVVDDDCPETGRCDNGLCIAKLGSCEYCDEDSDCASGVCSGLRRCAGPSGLLDDLCICAINSDCESGRCEGVSERVCEAKLVDGLGCNEPSDCVSGHCNLALTCGVPTEEQSSTIRSVGISLGVLVALISVAAVLYMHRRMIWMW
eukprot:CAMPEP_0118710652 /NCGR_PEP_ID=MMETSP0800-20121206/23531_1 /TAXON_ID=210618 ORGANISM="Striatella unipunctata, Strain CCMP2910" /NCGR_SAMPLE_ID=MMETSP0800 /ASSEMBLY_ACC=CAM_ASM_000638 /LENGTH=459 /DNA_ID=CAMNT_0006614919 /DNA_START=215 /DNA_END=1591 /DNA_ORIENTATION=+